MLLGQTPRESQQGSTTSHGKPEPTDTLQNTSIDTTATNQPPFRFVVGISAPLLALAVVFMVIILAIIIWKYKKKSSNSEQHDGPTTIHTSDHIYEQPNTATVQINSGFTIEEEISVNNGYTTLQQQDADPMYSTIKRSNAQNQEVTYANVDKTKKMQMKEDEEDDEIEGPPVPAYNPEESSAVEYKGEEIIEATYAVVNKKRRRGQVEEKEEEDEAPPIPLYKVESLDMESKKMPARE